MHVPLFPLFSENSPGSPDASDPAGLSSGKCGRPEKGQFPGKEKADSGVEGRNEGFSREKREDQGGDKNKATVGPNFVYKVSCETSQAGTPQPATAPSASVGTLGHTE